MTKQFRKVPEPPATRSGKAKQAWRMRKAGDYEPSLWTRLRSYQHVPVECHKLSSLEKARDPMGPASRVYVRKHYHTVIYAIDSVVSRRMSEVARSYVSATGGHGDPGLLTPSHELGLKGATKTREARFMEKVHRAPKSWWVGLDAHIEHIEVLKVAGDEALVEWLIQYRPHG